MCLDRDNCAPFGMLEYACLLFWVDIWGEGGGGGGGGANFFNYLFHVYFNAISDNFENKFMGGSNVRIDSNLT